MDNADLKGYVAEIVTPMPGALAVVGGQTVELVKQSANAQVVAEPALGVNVRFMLD
jgi:hypothetical protein